MHPVILRLPWFTVYSYGVFVAIGFSMAAIYFLHSLRSTFIPEKIITNMIAGIIVISLLASRFFYVLMNLDYYFTRPEKIFYIWEGGMVFYGGLFASILFSFFYIKLKNLDLGKIGDCSAPAIALGISIGRIGCFLNGCCYGIPSHFGFVFTPDSPAGRVFPGQRLFPVQLLSSFNLFVIFLILHILRKRKKSFSKLLPIFLTLYSLHRFFIEFLRGDTHSLVWGLTSFQIMSFSLLAISLIWWRKMHLITSNQKFSPLHFKL